ncbi:MAG: hypothetical protein ACYDDU_14230 [Dermatophilaceae bacterium]
MEAEAQSALGWRWFAAWMLVGGLYAFSLLAMLTIGLFVLPIPILATVLLVRRQEAGRGAFGLVGGIALPLLYVSLLNQSGPGMICSAIEGGTACTEQTSPWPWFAAGLAFLTLGTSAFWLSRPRSGRAIPQVNPLP